MRVSKYCLLVAVAAASAVATNILPNPSFEFWLGNMPVGWVTSEPLYPGSALPDSGSHSGALCVKLTGGDTSAFMSSATLIRTGYHYRFAGFARVPGTLGGSFVLQFLSLTGGTVGLPELVPVYYSGTNYREYSRWVTAPDSAVFLAVAFATLPGVTAYVDDVTVDDTTLVGIDDAGPAGAGPDRMQLRKVVVPVARASVSGQRSGRVWYDALGRRTTPVRWGVYLARH